MSCCCGSCGGEDVNKIKEQDNAEIENPSQEQKKKRK